MAAPDWNSLTPAAPEASTPSWDSLAPATPDFAQLEPYSEYLKKLPEAGIVRAYIEDQKSGTAIDRKAYEDAYVTRASEANWTGSEDKTGRTPDRSVVEVIKGGINAMGTGLGAQLAEGWNLAKNNFAKPGTPEYESAQKSFGNLVQGMSKGTLEGMYMLDQTASKIYNQLAKTGLVGIAPEEARTRQVGQFQRDLEREAVYDDVRAGKPLGMSSTPAYPTDPQAVEEIADSPFGDLEVVVPGSIAFKAARKPAQLAARTLEKTAAESPALIAKLAAKPLDYAAQVAAATERSIGSSPAVRAALAGGTALAVGADPATAVLAAIVGAETKAEKLISGARAGLESASKSVGAAGGPLSKFSSAAYRAATSPTAKAIVAGQLANAPFALGAQSEDEFKDAMAVGAIASSLGVGGEKIRSGLDVRANFWAPHDAPPEARADVKNFKVSDTLDAAHQQTMSEINNAGTNFVESIRNFLYKKGAGELYAVTPDGFKAALEELIAADPSVAQSLGEKDVSEAAASQGVTIRTKDENGKPRTVALFVVRDGAPGLGAGHEAIHMLERTLSEEQLNHIYSKLATEYGPAGIEGARRKYAQDHGVAPSTLSDRYVLSELFAESGSALLNSIPISEFGPNKGKGWKNTVREIYGLMAEGMRKVGMDVPETAVKQEYRGADDRVYTRWVPAQTSGPKTGLGFDPAVSGTRAVENILQAMALEKDVFEIPGTSTPTESSASPDRPNLADVREAVAPPVFKKGEKLAGDIFGPDGSVAGKDATILEVIEDDQGGEHKYRILFSSKGKVWEATVPQDALQSPVAPDATSTATPANPEIKQGNLESIARPTPESTVTPTQVENVTKPQATPTPAPAPKNVHVTPAQQEAFAAKATPEVVKDNIEVAQKADALPTNQKLAYETDYYSARGETGEDAVVRTERRKLADAAEKTGKKNPLRAIYQKIFIPYRYVPGPKPRVFGFSYDKLIQNVDILRGWAAANKQTDVAARLSNPQFANTVRDYLRNQSNGYGGDGRRITLPFDTRPGVTLREPGYTPVRIAPEDVQLVNLLMGIELPQKSSPASRFAARMARENGLTPTMNDAGVEITNPLYSDLVTAGFNPKLLNSVVENLPIDRMTTRLKPRPDVQFPAGDLAITRAGFMPQTSRRLVREPAIKLPNGKIYSEGPGTSHPYLWQSALDAGLMTEKELASGKFDDGFLDNDGKYITREAALKIALQAAQIESSDLPELKRSSGNDKKLNSDLLNEKQGYGAGFMPAAKREQGNDETRNIASQYIKANGTASQPHTEYVPVDEELAKELADFYVQAKHSPNDPEVQKAYQALASETMRQYQALTEAGIVIEPYEGAGEPYKSSKDMMADVKENKHLYFLKTEGNFSGDQTNPLLRDSGVKIDGKKLLVNDVFRAVHDFFGHTAEGFEFGPRGEYNAYLSHAKMFSPEAKPAFAAETLAQNSFVNYGPHLRREDGSIPAKGEEGFVPLKDRPFAEQKTLIVPQEFLDRADIAARTPAQRRQARKDSFRFLPGTQVWNIGLNVKGGEPLSTEQVLSTLRNAGLDPEQYEVKQSDTEPTLVAVLPETDDETVEQVARELSQEAIAVQNADGSGKLLGPRAAEWGDFNPEFFLLPSKNAPVEFAGIQEGGGIFPDFELYNLTEDIEGHPSGSTVSRKTLEDAGYRVPAQGAQFLPAPPVESEAFKKWFGDWSDPKALTSRRKGPSSVVVNPDGTPLTVYHATTGDFNSFETGRPTKNSWALGSWDTERHAIFTTPDAAFAEEYIEGKRGGRVLPLYLNIQSPIDLRGVTIDSYEEDLPGVDMNWASRVQEPWELLDGKDGKAFVELAKKAGFDGLIFQENTGNRERTVDVFAAFDPTQVKSAIGNKGTYDPTNPDIRFLPAAPVQHDGKPLKDSLGKKVLNLVHFGGTGINQVDPKNFGKSGLTPRSELSGLPRSYFYEEGKVNKTDPVAQRNDVYGAKVSGAKIYDGDADPLDYSAMINREKADEMLRKAGYIGIARSGRKYRQIELFTPTAVVPVNRAASFLPANSPIVKLNDFEWKRAAGGGPASWMDPEGRLHPVGQLSHEEWAEKYLNEKNAQPKLQSQDWARVVTERDADGNRIVYVNHTKPLRKDQRSELERLAIQHELVLMSDRGNKVSTLYEPPQAASFLPSAPDSPEFKAWFGKSKAVDKSGKPRTYLHGTSEDFSVFSKAKIGSKISRWGAGTLKDGFFFTSDPEIATRYNTGLGGRTLPVFLKIENPAESLEEMMDNPEFDGFINSKVAVVREPEQIKSAIGNKGTFDPNNPDIRFLPDAKVAVPGKGLQDVSPKPKAKDLRDLNPE
jgi:hypothetical protein